MKKPSPFVVDAQALGAVLGVSRNRVLELVAAGMPCERRGSKARPWQFDLRRVVPWYGDHREQLGGEATAKLDPKQEKARLDRATAELREHDLATRRGEYVPADALDRTLITLATVVSGRLQGIPSQLAPELAAATTRTECEQLVERAIDEALHDLTDAGAEAAKRSAA